MELDVSGEHSEGDKDKTAIPNPVKELAQTVRDLKGAPRVFWIMNYTYMLDGMAYFGMLTLLTIFLHQNLGLADSKAHLIVSVKAGAASVMASSSASTS